MPRPWLPLYCADYLADTRDLSAEEHGVYCVLLMESWLRGPLPDDLDRLRRMAAGAQSQSVRTVLERYWQRTDSGWVNPRMERERETCEVKYQAKVERIAAARARREACNQGSNQACNQGSGQDSNQACNQGLISVSKSPVQPQPQPQLILKDYIPSVCVESQAYDPVDNLAAPKVNGCPYQAIVDLYHELLVPPLARVFKLTQGRRQHISARWREDLTDLDDWRAYFGAVRRTRLVAGFRRKDGTLWKPDFGWLLRPENFAKVTEGAYGQVR